jgi:hypothetical protein
MLAGMIASMVSLIVDKHSFYDHLKLNYLLRLEEEEKNEHILSPTNKTKIDTESEVVKE